MQRSKNKKDPVRETFWQKMDPVREATSGGGVPVDEGILHVPSGTHCHLS
jgi:hypothetical protein